MSTPPKSAALLAALAILAMPAYSGPQIDCHVPRCAYTSADGKCLPQQAETINARCDEWNSQGSGTLPPGERIPKPPGIVQIRAKIKTFNACVAKALKRHVPTQQAIADCKDNLD